MSEKKDYRQKNKPKGFFPLSYDQVEVEGLGLKTRMEYEPQRYSHGHLMAELYAPHELVIYAIPKTLREAEAEKKLSQFLIYVKDHCEDKELKEKGKVVAYSYFCAYLNNNELVMTRNDVKFKKGKFRDDSNFQSPFNLKNSVSIETIIAL